MVWGEIRENLVLLKISITSIFLLISSPSFSPDARWVHTKQNVDWFNVMLMDIDPYKTTHLAMQNNTLAS